MGIYIYNCFWGYIYKIPPIKVIYVFPKGLLVKKPLLFMSEFSSKQCSFRKQKQKKQERKQWNRFLVRRLSGGMGSKTRPIFPMPGSQHYSDYGFDSQFDYFQVFHFFFFSLSTLFLRTFLWFLFFIFYFRFLNLSALFSFRFVKSSLLS